MIFKSMYRWVIGLARHRLAPWFLGAVSFAESSFFLIPPDVMLIPMSLGRPDRAMRFALITTLTSVFGGMAGYLIGMWAFEWVEPILHQYGYWESYLHASALFKDWGFVAVLVAGFSPIPYKVFTISAGVLRMNFPLFVLASVIGRGARFFLVAGLLRWGGVRMEQMIEKQVERLGWASVILVAAGGLIWWWVKM
jgi:membrane protein YqaA with SNARE-associated domain